MQFNKTIAYPRGQLVHSALATLVCNLLAAHKIAGFKSHPACNLCPSHSSKVDLHNIEYRAWGECTYVEHMEAAEQWCDASSRAQHKRAFDRTGTWWSELLHLPYWDLTCFIIIDGMHNLWLGMMQFHVHVLLGINESKSSNAKELKRVKSILSHTQDPHRMKRFLVPILLALCDEMHLQRPVSPRKSQLIQMLIVCA